MTSTGNSFGRDTQGISDRHWWHDARAGHIRRLVGAHLRGGERVANIGCSQTSWTDFVPAGSTGVDVDRGAEPSVGRAFVMGDATHLPLPDNAFDVALLLDVVEHFERPEPVVAEARRILRPGGLVVITVPAVQWLFSDYDRQVGHFKRYDKKGIDHLLADTTLRKCTYFFSFLVPFAAARRILGSADVGTKNGPFDGVLRGAAAIERRLIMHTSLPIGTSLLAIGEV